MAAPLNFDFVRNYLFNQVNSSRPAYTNTTLIFDNRKIFGNICIWAERPLHHILIGRFRNSISERISADHPNVGKCIIAIIASNCGNVSWDRGRFWNVYCITSITHRFVLKYCITKVWYGSVFLYGSVADGILYWKSVVSNRFWFLYL